MIRKAVSTDVLSIAKLAAKFAKELGFIMRAQIANDIENDRVLVYENEGGEIRGYVSFLHRKRDLQTTLYCIATYDHGAGHGRELLNALIEDARSRSREFILLKCPVGLPSNQFYGKFGFIHQGVQPPRSGNPKHRSLNIWKYVLS